jgi:hypothetical protein
MPRNCVCKHGGAPGENRLEDLPRDLQREINKYLPIYETMLGPLPEDMELMIRDFLGPSREQVGDRHQALMHELSRALQRSGASPIQYGNELVTAVGNPSVPSWERMSQIERRHHRVPMRYITAAIQDMKEQGWDHSIPSHYARATEELVRRHGGKMPSPKRRKKGGVLRPPTNETGLIGQPTINPREAELREHIAGLRRQYDRLSREFASIGHDASVPEKRRRQVMNELGAVQDRIAIAEDQLLDVMTTSWARNPAPEEPSPVNATPVESDWRDDYFAHPANQHGQAYEQWRREREDEMDANRSMEELQQMMDEQRMEGGKLKRRRRRKKGAGWEDELAKAVERDRLNEIDKAEAKRLMAEAERAKRASLSQAHGKRKRAH